MSKRIANQGESRPPTWVLQRLELGRAVGFEAAPHANVGPPGVILAPVLKDGVEEGMKGGGGTKVKEKRRRRKIPRKRGRYEGGTSPRAAAFEKPHKSQPPTRSKEQNITSEG